MSMPMTMCVWLVWHVLLRGLTPCCRGRGGGVVNRPTRWSLSQPLGLFIDHPAGMYFLIHPWYIPGCIELYIRYFLWPLSRTAGHLSSLAKYASSWVDILQYVSIYSGRSGAFLSADGSFVMKLKYVYSVHLWLVMAAKLETIICCFS